MHFDNQSISTRRNRGFRHRRYQTPHSGSMRRICEYWQMRQFFHERHCRQVERVSCRSLESLNAAFTQDHVRVPTGEQVFSRQ